MHKLALTTCVLILTFLGARVPRGICSLRFTLRWEDSRFDGHISKRNSMVALSGIRRTQADSGQLPRNSNGNPRRVRRRGWDASRIFSFFQPPGIQPGLMDRAWVLQAGPRQPGRRGTTRGAITRAPTQGRPQPSASQALAKTGPQ